MSIVKKAKRMVDLIRKDGSEVPDPKPVVSQVKTNRPVSIQQQVRQLVDQQLAAAAEAENFESPEDADDFDIGEDYDPESPYEYNFDPFVDPPDTNFVEEVPEDNGENSSGTGDDPSDSGVNQDNTSDDKEEKK